MHFRPNIELEAIARHSVEALRVVICDYFDNIGKNSRYFFRLFWRSSQLCKYFLSVLQQDGATWPTSKITVLKKFLGKTLLMWVPIYLSLPPASVAPPVWWKEEDDPPGRGGALATKHPPPCKSQEQALLLQLAFQGSGRARVCQRGFARRDLFLRICQHGFLHRDLFGNIVLQDLCCRSI